MNKHDSVIFLFNVINEIERSFQYPIIFFSETDFTENIYDSLLSITKAIHESSMPETLLEIIKNFHIEWLDAVNKIEKFRKSLKAMPRDTVLRAIDFTIKCLEKRYACLYNSVEELQNAISNEEKELLSANLEIILELQKINQNALLKKQENILNQADQDEYLNQIYDEIEELLVWLDRQYDNLAIHLTKVLDLHIPMAPSDLSIILKEIIEELAVAPDPESRRVSNILKLRSRTSQMIPISSLHELEITRLIVKIQDLEDRIRKLEGKDSPALMALQHRAIYLKGKVESLQNIKQSMIRLQEEACIMNETSEELIFSHSLLFEDRLRLVERLIKVWDDAITINSQDSIVSILSATNMKQVFYDNIGQFTVDIYGRKIYDKDNVKYQLNEVHELVPVADDKHRPYFYDDCGRYYLNAENERVYKAHAKASEYLLSSGGLLLKVKEVINGIEYNYDRLGRYYINQHGQRIYREKGRNSEYEYDGIGNLLKINRPQYFYEPYVKKPLTIEDNQYLQRVVGSALKRCIANVVIHRPTDPVAYLADSLVKYKLSMDEQQRNLDEEKERLEHAFLYTTNNDSSPPVGFNLDNYEIVYNLQGEDY